MLTIFQVLVQKFLHNIEIVCFSYISLFVILAKLHLASIGEERYIESEPEQNILNDKENTHTDNSKQTIKFINWSYKLDDRKTS